MANTTQTHTVHKLYTLRQIRQAAKNAGSVWFSPTVLQFSATRISDRVYPVPNGALFISSEQVCPLGGENGPRLYSIRSCRCDGIMATVGEFQQYQTYETAHNAAAKMQKDGFSLV